MGWVEDGFASSEVTRGMDRLQDIQIYEYRHYPCWRLSALIRPWRLASRLKKVAA